MKSSELGVSRTFFLKGYDKLYFILKCKWKLLKYVLKSGRLILFKFVAYWEKEIVCMLSIQYYNWTPDLVESYSYLIFLNLFIMCFYEVKIKVKEHKYF